MLQRTVSTPGDADALVGRVELPLLGGQLREDMVFPELGLPRDLNGDGIIDALDHSTDCVLIPMRVSVDWQSRKGPRTVTLTTIIVPFMDPDTTGSTGFVDPSITHGGAP